MKLVLKLLLLATVLISSSISAKEITENKWPLGTKWWEKATRQDFETIINNGANINHIFSGIDPYAPIPICADYNVLMVASKYNKNPEVIETLIKHGANVNEQIKTDINEKGITALMIASKYNNNPAIIETLIKNGADINIKTPEGGTALIYAAENPNPQIIKTLVENGADVNTITIYKTTALLLATRRNHNPEVIKLLIAKGADINAKDEYNQNILMYAVGNPTRAIIELIINLGVNLNEKDKFGNTALIIATEYAPISTIRIETLLKHGADTRIRNNQGETATDIAKRQGRQDILSLLQKYQWSGDHGEHKWKPCTDTYPYTSAPYYGKTYETDQMSDMQVSKAICKVCNPYRKYADGFCHVVKSPIAEKPLIDIKPISWDKDNNPTHYLYDLYPCDTTRPVLFAMQEDCEKCPNREYKDGLCIIKGNDKDTPLRMAALTASNPEIIKKLVANGADINAKDIVGNTILMYAAHNQNKAIVEILIELGADVYAKNINDETALIFSGWASSPGNMILEQYHMNNKNLPPPAQPADAGTNKKKYLDGMP